MAVTLQFVDSISASATVRLDLNASPWRLRKNPDLSPPPLKRAIVGSLLRDGELVPASAYANRTLKLPLSLETATSDLTAAQLQLLHRELDRPTNFLKYSSGETNPVYFRTLRSPQYGLNMEWTTPRDDLVLEILAEPFAYGLKQSFAAKTIAYDPAAATNPQYADYTGVLGDVATPAYVQVDQSSGTNIKRCVFAQRSHGTPSDLVRFVQAEAMTQGTDTSTQANTPVMSGAGNNFSRITFATNNTLTAARLTATNSFPGTGLTSAQQNALPGKYRVFVRCSSPTGDTFTIKTRYLLHDGLAVDMNTVTQPMTSTTRYMLDMGVIEWPAAEDGYSGVAIKNTAVSFQLFATRAGASANLDIDYVCMVPADEALCILEFTNTQSADFILDGPQDTVVKLGGSQAGSDRRLWIIKRAGSLPYLVPNQTNRLYFLEGVGDTDTPVTATHNVTVSYWPRFLYVSP